MRMDRVDEGREEAGATSAPGLQRGARVYLLLLAILASGVPFTHYRFIDQTLDRVRYPWGLLPAEFLFLRWFGELSIWFPAGLFVAFACSFFQPLINRSLLVATTTAFLIFIVAYLCYALLIVSALLRSV